MLFSSIFAPTSTIAPKSYLLILLAAFGLMAPPALGENPVLPNRPLAPASEIRIAAAELAPHAGQLLPEQGWVPRVLALALIEHGYAPHIQFMPFRRALSSAQQGKVEAIAPLYKSPAREAYLLFSDPLGVSATALFYRRAHPVHFERIQDLAGLKVAVMRGARVSDDFDSFAQLVRVEVTSYEQQVRMLMAGRVDAIVGEEFVVRAMIERQYRLADHDIVQAPSPVALQAMYVGVAKSAIGAQEKLVAINAGVAKLAASGVLQSVLAEYGIHYDQGRLSPRPLPPMEAGDPGEH
ncbi:transporter substrate-binding domain-containing protein [Simiduia sp. 21SJ11W-1]|uniref:substrate-binding periplasmic protein n=1 Tax=Simiduia sp. 21SJ11W-1 TaxID=2909669 RepID=UPI0020A133B8|nr:transporter substrate-binding domain-containing protein [Simiduia sp. 21SJ11W-1]UTA46778.1 transporter substrate-binding domain-containing protein [Simiduia sp. 21SJ11W-1]